MSKLVVFFFFYVFYVEVPPPHTTVFSAMVSILPLSAIFRTDFTFLLCVKSDQLYNSVLALYLELTDLIELKLRTLLICSSFVSFYFLSLLINTYIYSLFKCIFHLVSVLLFPSPLCIGRMS